MLNVALALVGAVVGFVASRRLRRPDRAAQAASVARNVSGSLGRRRGLTPPELQRACFSEMVRHVQVSPQGRTVAPAAYNIHLHPDDMATVDESRRWFTEGLRDALNQAARKNGWNVEGRVHIDFEPDPARRPGVPSAVATAPEPRPSPAPQTWALTRSDTGERITLGNGSLAIGRSRERDVTIDDDRVSRNHARIDPHEQGWVIVDVGSSNGTTVGGKRLEPNRARRLKLGDVVHIGPVALRVAATPAAGVRALDDSDRQRISREVLPPGVGDERR